MKLHIKWLARLKAQPPTHPHQIMVDIDDEIEGFKEALKPYYRQQVQMHGHKDAELWYKQNAAYTIEQVLQARGHLFNENFYQAMRILENNQVPIGNNVFFQKPFWSAKYIVYYSDEYGMEATKEDFLTPAFYAEMG